MSCARIASMVLDLSPSPPRTPRRAAMSPSTPKRSPMNSRVVTCQSSDRGSPWSGGWLEEAATDSELEIEAEPPGGLWQALDRLVPADVLGVAAEEHQYEDQVVPPGFRGTCSGDDLHGSASQASCGSTCTPEKTRESPRRLQRFDSLGAEEPRGPKQLRRVLSVCDEDEECPLLDEESPSVAKMPSPKRARAGGRELECVPQRGRGLSLCDEDEECPLLDEESPSVAKMPSPKRARAGDCSSTGKAEPSPEAALLIQRVLCRAGSRSEKVIAMLRERIAAGRKVHGRLFTLGHVDEAVRHFRNTPVGEGGGKDAARDGPSQKLDAATRKLEGSRGNREGDKERVTMLPFRSKAQPLAYQGSYMPPAAVSRLVGDDICPICLEPLREQAQTIAMCGHIFHRHCLNDAGSIRCPTCRRPVDLGRASVQELKSLVLSTRAIGTACGNLLELTRAPLLADCNRRRRDGNPLFTTGDLNQALGELAEEAGESLIVEEDSVVLLL